MEGEDHPGARPTESVPPKRMWRRILPVVLLIAGAIFVYLFDLHTFLALESLQANREMLTGFVSRHLVWAAVAYILIYSVATAVSLPGGAALSVTGGFLFGGWQGGILVVIGATVGATAVFLIARTALGDSLHRRAGPWLSKMEAGFQENALSYLLTLRLIPVFPFFVVNLVPAFLGVGLGTYVLGTAVGIIPGALVFTYAGAGLGSVLDAGAEFSVGSVLTPEILLALTGLGLLSLLPVVFGKLKRAA